MTGATLTVHFRLDGYMAALALEGESGKELLDKAGAVIEALRKIGAEPTPSPALASGNGGRPEALPETKVCPIHHVTMKRRVGKGGDVWYSHKAVDPETGAEYWCRGEERRNGGGGR